MKLFKEVPIKAGDNQWVGKAIYSSRLNPGYQVEILMVGQTCVFFKEVDSIGEYAHSIDHFNQTFEFHAPKINLTPYVHEKYITASDSSPVGHTYQRRQGGFENEGTVTILCVGDHCVFHKRNNDGREERDYIDDFNQRFKFKE